MGRAAYQAGAVIEELVRLPVQPDLSMRAAVAIDENVACPTHGQQGLALSFETAAVSFRQLVRGTEKVQSVSPAG